MGRSFNALALFAATAIAGPLRDLENRQASSTPAPTSSATASAATTASELVSAATTLDNGIRLAAAETVDAGDSTRVCTLSSVSATTLVDVISYLGTPTTLYSTEITPTIECACDDGWGAGIGTSVGGDGHSTLTCQFGSATNIGVSTATPTPTPGSAENPGWADVSCSYGSLTDATNNPLQQWNDSGASAAWDAMLGNFKFDNKGLNLTSFIGNYFHSEIDLSCEMLGSDNCDNNINCGEQAFPNAVVNSPAGYMIINGIVGFHQQFDHFYEGLNNALTEVIGQIGTFTDTFSPISELIDEQKEEKLTLDGIQLGLGIVAGFTFSSWFQKLKFFQDNPNYLGIVGDTTASVIGTAFGFVKDAMDSESSLPIQNNISSHVVETVNSWIHGTAGMASGIFNDPDTLYSMISDGKTFIVDAEEGPVELTDLAEKAIFANTIPMAWTLGATGQMPFIATSQDVPTGDGSGCEAPDPTDGIGSECDDCWQPYLKDGDGIFEPSRFCDGDTAYWMMGVMVSDDNPCARTMWDETHSNVPNYKCYNDKYETRIMQLKGFDTLDGTKWGGLTKENIFNNALNSWKSNGNQNGWPTADVTTQEGMDQLVDGDIEQAKGLVSIPICSFKEMMDTTYDDQANDQGNVNWPCPA